MPSRYMRTKVESVLILLASFLALPLVAFVRSGCMDAESLPFLILFTGFASFTLWRFLKTLRRPPVWLIASLALVSVGWWVSVR